MCTSVANGHGHSEKGTGSKRTKDEDWVQKKPEKKVLLHYEFALKVTTRWSHYTLIVHDHVIF